MDLKYLLQEQMELPKCLTLIKEGTLPSAVAQNPYDMGYLSVQTALK